MPCYNAARFIKEAIESVIAQVEPSWELIVVDDGSTDSSADIVRGFDDNRIQLIEQSNAGVSAARNAGLAISKGEFVAFLDADDRMLPNRLAVGLNIVDQHPSIDIVVNDFIRFEHESGKYLERQFEIVQSWRTIPHRRVTEGNVRIVEGCAILAQPYLQPTFIWTQNILLRGSRARSAAFPVGVPICEDAWYLYRVMPNARMAIVEDMLVELRRHDTNSFSDPAAVLTPLLTMFRALQLEGFSEPVSAKYREGEGRALLQLGYHHRQLRDRRTAALYYSRACAISATRTRALRGLLASLIGKPPN